MSPQDATVDLPVGARAVTEACRVVPTVLRGWGFHDPSWLDDATLIVAELVSNAVRHAGGCRALTLHAHGNRVTVAAVDTSPARPRRREVDNTGGNGLLIVEALSVRWGVDDHPDGKHVWAELAAPPRRQTASADQATTTQRRTPRDRSAMIPDAGLRRPAGTDPSGSGSADTPGPTTAATGIPTPAAGSKKTSTGQPAVRQPGVPLRTYAATAG